MALVYTTAAVIASKSGTGWTIDVTSANLDDDITLKDFIVLFGTTVQSNTVFSKVSKTILQYTGSSIGTTTVEVRRATPIAPYKEIRYGDRFASNDYNRETNRRARLAAEWQLFGLGSVGGITFNPINDAYGASWSTDVQYAPTRQALYNKFESVITNYTAADAAINTSLASYAPLASPAFTGTPTAPTPNPNDSSTKLQTTAGVKNLLADVSVTKTIANGVVDVTPTKTDNDTSIATTAFAHLASVVKKVHFVQQTASYGATSSHATITGLSITLTPRSASSSFLCIANLQMSKAALANVERTRILAGATTVVERRASTWQGSIISHPTLVGVISPATASSITIAVQAMTEGGTINFGDATTVNDLGTLTVIEFENIL